MRFLISCCVDQWKRMLTSRENISVEIYAGHSGCYVMPDAGSRQCCKQPEERAAEMSDNYFLCSLLCDNILNIHSSIIHPHHLNLNAEGGGLGRWEAR